MKCDSTPNHAIDEEPWICTDACLWQILNADRFIYLQDKGEGGPVKSSHSGSNVSVPGYSGQQQLPAQPTMPSTTVTSGEPWPSPIC